MNMDDTPEEARFRKEVADWMAANAPAFEQRMALRPSMDEQVEAGKAWQAHKARHGYGAILWPKERGGRGGTPIDMLIFRQEELKYELPLGPYINIGLGLACPTLFRHGTPEQIDALAGPTLRGEFTWCQLFSEPSAGSDLAGIRTRAVRDGDSWVVNGQKVWNSWAAFGSWAILVTRSDPSVPKHSGLTYFILDMKTPGIEVRPIRQMAGDAEFCEVFLTDVRIPDKWRLGAVNDGWNVALTTLSNERMGFGASYDVVSCADLVKLARQATLRGRPALEDSYVRERIASFFARENGLKLFAARVQTKLSKGQTPGLEGAINKLLFGQKVQDMAAFAMELHGPMGSVDDPQLAPLQPIAQRSLLVSAAYRIAGGADEIMRNQISEKVLGLPAEMRPDKGVPFDQLDKPKR